MFSISEMECFTLFCTLLFCCTIVNAWYLPGSGPTDYLPSSPVALKVDKLTSAKTQLPFSFYHLPYCQPENIEHQVENLGEILTGGVVQNTPFKIYMQKDDSCRLLCSKTLTADQINQFTAAIDDEYMVNIMADNLPAVVSHRNGVAPNVDIPSTFSTAGIPVGLLLSDNKYILLNHWDFIIRYNVTRGTANFRVVGFEVSPRSINQEKLTDNKYNCDVTQSAVLDKSKKEQPMTFTYSVRFVSSPEQWTARWGVYLNSTPDSLNIHWFSIINALVIVLLLSGLIAIILLRTLLRDIARYNQLDDLEESQEEFGWKLVHGDVFRRPNYSKLLAACAGTGVQLFGMISVTLLFATLGVLSPASRGSLIQAALLLFTFMGWPAGYVSARFNKLFEGDDITRNFTVTCMTALQFPGVCFGVFFVLNVILWSQGSSGAVPFGTMFLLLLMWFGISIPLVFLGSRFGYKKPTVSIPVRINQIPRQIPPAHWMLSPATSHVVTGVLPFCSVFTELLFILGSVWLHRFYYLFGFLSLVVIILAITCAEISIAITYFNLTSEQYRWWWKSYWASASSALYVFLYSVFYFFTRLRITKPASVALYFGYTFLMSYTFLLFTGAVGFVSAFWFVRAIYGAVKVD